MERVGGFVELFTQKVPAVCARQKNNPSTASGPPSFARKVKCFSYGIAPTFPPSLGRETISLIWSFSSHFSLIKTDFASKHLIYGHKLSQSGSSSSSPGSIICSPLSIITCKVHFNCFL